MRIFLDTEFTDFTGPELISVGMITEDGKHEFYGEVLIHEWIGRESDFVRENIVPLLNGPAHTKDRLEEELLKWLKSLPYDELDVVVDYHTDWNLLVDVFDQVQNVVGPTFYGVGLFNAVEALEKKLFLSRPEKIKRVMQAEQTYREVYTMFKDELQPHHALHDARAARQGFIDALGTMNRGVYRPLQLWDTLD